MTFWFVMTCLFALWNVRLLAVNSRLRKTDPFDLAWRRFEKRQRAWRAIQHHAAHNPRHPSSS